MRTSHPARPARAVVLLLFLLLVAVSCSSTQSSAAPAPPSTTAPTRELTGEPVPVAVLAIRSAVAANAQYGPILEHLERETGRPFTLVPVGQEEQFHAVEEGLVDFVFTNPLSGVQIRRLYGTEFLATLSRIETGPSFSGLIISREGSGIETAEDVRGTDVTCVAFQTAAGGCNFQLMHLHQLAIGPEDFASFTETPSQDNIVLSVLNGAADVGFVRTGHLEKMVAEGTLTSIDQVNIVDRVDDDYFYPHTTRLYPEWPLAALPDTDPALVDAVRNALLEMSPEDPAMVNVGAVGFVDDTDYGPVDDMIVTLELRSSDASTS